MNKPNAQTSIPTKQNNNSIEHLRIYQLARSLEDRLFVLAKSLPEDQFYPIGNDLRRASAAVAHHIAETHKRFSYTIKLEALHSARTAAEDAIALLKSYDSGNKDEVSALVEDYEVLIRQSWGLIKYLKNKQTFLASKEQARATDELVAARS